MLAVGDFVWSWGGNFVLRVLLRIAESALMATASIASYFLLWCLLWRITSLVFLLTLTFNSCKLSALEYLQDRPGES